MGIIVVVVIGLIAGLILSVASIVFAVPVNETEEALVGVLPGANCGACGFARLFRLCSCFGRGIC